MKRSLVTPLAVLGAAVLATAGVVIVQTVAGQQRVQPVSSAVSDAVGTLAPAARDQASHSAAASRRAADANAPNAPEAVGTWTPRPATYEIVVERDVPITMSDGTRLYADIYRPARDGKAAPGRFPVLLTQTPYNKNGAAVASIAGSFPYLISRGYVQVLADVRGTGSSRGTWGTFSKREQRDGDELVRWAASSQRAWSNGKVGTVGASYMAINQLFTAAQRPSGLKASFAMVPGADPYRDTSFSGGQVDVGFVPFWLSLITGAGLVPPAYTATDPGDGTLEGITTLLEHAGNTASHTTPLLLEGALGGERAFDGPWWRERSPIEVVDNIRTPMFVVGGWYDIFQRGTPLLYERLQRNGVPTKLLMGPWNHLQASEPPDIDPLRLRWFDHYLRGMPDATLNSDIAPVTYYELGADKWRTAGKWMPPDVHARAYQLDGPAGPGSPGTLTTGTAKTAEPDSIAQVPVTGLCTRSTSQWTAGILAATDNICARDQRLDSSLGTTYDLPPSNKALRLLGPVNARLFTSTTAQDGMIAARLESVAPDGTVQQLTAGWQVLSLRKLDRSRSRIVDGRVLQPYHPYTRDSVRPMAQAMEVNVEIFPTGAVIPAGHRLRLNLQAFDTPHLLPTLPQGLNSAGVISIHHDATHPSQLILPVRR